MYDTIFHKNDISKSSFLVSGGAGFIGSNIVEYLIKNNAGKVRVIDNLSTGFKENLEAFMSLENFEFFEGDISILEDCMKACKGIDYISHQAALGSVPRSIKNPEKTNAANVTGFVNMLVAAKENNVKRLVYASSSSVYGDSEDLPKKEDKTGRALSPYAVSKFANELYADVFSRVYNLELIGFRYFNIFGPRQNPKGAYAAVIPRFIESTQNNKESYIDGDGEQSRDFTFVENAVQANIRALLTDNDKAINKVYNIAVGGNSTINNLHKLINKAYNTSINPIYRDERSGDIRNSIADISLAKELLGYEPGVELEEGIKITAEWFNNYLS